MQITKLVSPFVAQQEGRSAVATRLASMSSSWRTHSEDTLSTSDGSGSQRHVGAGRLALALQLRARSVTPTPVSSARTPRDTQFDDRGTFLERQLLKVEHQLADAHADRDELLSRVQAVTEKVTFWSN